MATAPSRQMLWTRAATTYAVYVVAGMLSLWVATTGDDISQLYIAAGFGLALVLGWGRVMSWAVGAGSATVSMIGHLWLHQGTLDSQAWTLILVSGVGGGLQVWLAARWLQGPDDHCPQPLDKVTEVARFLLIAGPLACLINATLSTSVMVAVGHTPPQQWLAALAGWWAGDTLGVLMGTPMLLTLVGRPGRLWHQRRLIVGVPLLLATLLLALGIRQVQTWENQREVAEFQQQSESIASAVRMRLNGYLAAIEAMRGVYDASDTVERDEFRRASKHWITHLKGIQGMGWEERLLIDRLAEFEAQQQGEGLSNYKVFDLPGRRAPKDPEIVALRFIEPMEGNESALGFNVLSRDITRRSFEQSVQGNVPVATPGFKLAQESAQQLGVVIYRAVYRSAPESGPIPRSAVLGAVFLTLRMDDAMAAVLKGMPPYMQACLMDLTDAQPVLLSGNALCRQQAQLVSRLNTSVELPFAGRRWVMQLHATAPVPVVGGRSTSWLFAVGGVAFAAALGALLLVITGTTERMAAAVDEARQQRAAAEAANLAKSEFLSRMSHELRTPLNAILGFAQVMSIDSLNPLNKVQESRIDQIQQAGWHLLDMIDDVLDISRIDSGALNLQTEKLDLAEVLKTTGNLVGDLARKQQITVHMDATLPAGWGIQADGTRLRQVITNLLTNAVKYNRRGGRVDVQAQLLSDASRPMVALVVTDTGMGMSETQLSQLFQPFNRLGREKALPDGTGIGLVISRHLVQLMGGTLEAISEEGKGSTFTLTLPAAALKPPETKAAALGGGIQPHQPNTHQATRHVLYVEDNDANTAVIEAALLGRPWIQLNVAATIEEGLAALHDRMRGPLPDLILLDVHLPDASGLDFLKLVKANPESAHIPVVMISADAMPEQIDACLKAGAACYLTKPLQIGALLQQTDALLNAKGA